MERLIYKILITFSMVKVEALDVPQNVTPNQKKKLNTLKINKIRNKKLAFNFNEIWFSQLDK